MRINQRDKDAIISAVKSKDPEAEIWLFGSRTDDSKRGGDIDIAILSSQIGRLDRMQIRRTICNTLGEQKIDIIVSAHGEDAFFQLAKERGVKLHA